MRNYRLHLIRHGMTQGNREGWYVGRTDLPVCPEGLRELESLRSRLPYPAVDLVYTSPLLRCRQTSQLLYPDAQLVVVDELCELDMGEFTGQPIAACKQHPAFAQWMQDAYHHGPPGGETGQQLAARVGQGISNILAHMSRSEVFEAAVVCHGGVITSLLAAYGIPRLPSIGWVVDNGTGFTVSTSLHSWTRFALLEITGVVPEGRQESPGQQLMRQLQRHRSEQGQNV